MKRSLLPIVLLLAAGPALAGPDDERAALESAERISAQLDRVLRDARVRMAIERATPSGGVRITPEGLVFVDGAEVPFDQLEWVETVARRRRQPTRTDTLLRIGPGTTLSLSNLAGDIRVTTWDRNEVRVQAEHDRDDRLVTEWRDAVVRLGVSSPQDVASEVEWTLTVPAWLPLELTGIESEILVSGMKSPVRAQSMRGDVTVSACQGPMQVNSVEGEVHVTDVRGNVTAGSVNSVVRIVRVSGPVEAQTINGDIQLVKVESPNVDASTVNGRVYFASGYQPRGRYQFSSHNGKLVVPVPETQPVKVRLSSFQGQVESSVPVPAPAARSRAQHYHFVIRDGVAVPEPAGAPSPPAPRGERAPRWSPAPAAPAAPEIELESFGGLIRLASEEEVLKVLTAQREVLRVRRASLDSMRIQQYRMRGEYEQARRLERMARSRAEAARRAPVPADAPEPPPPPAPRD